MDSDFKIPTNRNFGITISIALLIINIILIYYFSTLSHLLILIMFFFLILGIFNSFILFPLNYLWFSLGIFLSRFFSPIFITFFFYLIFTPYSFLGKLISKDIRNFKTIAFDNDGSFWENNQKKNDFRKQY